MLDASAGSVHDLVMTPRLRRVMKLVDELQLDSEELRTLSRELSARSECIVDLDVARSPEERALMVTVKSRVDKVMSGEAKTYSVAETTRYVRDRLKAAQRGRARKTG
ncbi:MAG: hypothetical protein ACHREM_07705 [Polyangiales bacterium]